MKSAEVHEMLEHFCPKRAGSPLGSGGTIRVADFLAHLASKWPADPSDDELTGLNALCRKLSVVKVIRQEYPFDWGRGSTTQSLTPTIQVSLVAILLAYGSRQSSGRDERGMQLKLTNAAFMALDSIEPGLADTTYLNDAARRVLNDLLLDQHA